MNNDEKPGLAISVLYFPVGSNWVSSEGVDSSSISPIRLETRLPGGSSVLLI